MQSVTISLHLGSMKDFRCKLLQYFLHAVQRHSFSPKALRQTFSSFLWKVFFPITDIFQKWESLQFLMNQWLNVVKQKTKMGQTLSFSSSAHIKIRSPVKALANVWQTVTFFLDMRVGKRLSLPLLFSFPPNMSLSFSLSFTHPHPKPPPSLEAHSFFGRGDQNKNRNTRHRSEKYAMIQRLCLF